MTKSTITRERLEEIILDNSASLEEFMAITRMALAAMDSEPVAWTDEEELRDANKGGSGYLFGIGHDANKFADPRRQIMLYRHAQPVPVVPDGYVMVPKEPTEDMLRASYRDASVYSAKAYRAMLAAAPHDTTALNPVQSALSVQGWIPVSERKPEESGRYWCYVEEQNDLGKSHYQWNCSWNGERW